VLAVGYNAECVQCVTWGGIKLVTWQFIATYCDEGFAVFGDADEPNIRVFDGTQDADGEYVAEYLLQDEIRLPGTPSRDLKTSIAQDIQKLPSEPRWGIGSRIWIDRPPPGHWEYVP
jgi:hypothetical protein